MVDEGLCAGAIGQFVIFTDYGSGLEAAVLVSDPALVGMKSVVGTS